VKSVGAGLGRRVEDTAAGPSHLGVERVDLDLHVFDRFDRRVEDGKAAHVGDRHAVERVVVGLDAAAAERQLRGDHLILLAVEPWLADVKNGRHGHTDHERVSAGRRQVLERPTVEYATLGRV
jgi:hypothetical protein